MYKMTTTVTYYVPDGRFCNIDNKDRCRFCIQHSNGYTCALSQQLLKSSGRIVTKSDECMWKLPEARRHVDYEVHVSPSEMLDIATNNFIKLYRALRDQGFPEEIALQLARKKLKE